MGRRKLMREDREAFRKRIYERRKELGIPGYVLAKLIGISDSYFYNIQNGRVPTPLPWVVVALASRLNLDPTELLDLAGYTDGVQLPMITDAGDSTQEIFKPINQEEERVVFYIKLLEEYLCSRRGLKSEANPVEPTILVDLCKLDEYAHIRNKAAIHVKN